MVGSFHRDEARKARFPQAEGGRPKGNPQPIAGTVLTPVSGVLPGARGQEAGQNAQMGSQQKDAISRDQTSTGKDVCKEQEKSHSPSEQVMPRFVQAKGAQGSPGSNPLLIKGVKVGGSRGLEEP